MCLCARGLAEPEVGVVDQPEIGSRGCSDRRRHDVVTHVSYRSVLHRAARDGCLNSCRNVIDAPVDQGTVGRVSVGQWRELVARDVESNVEGLIELRLLAEQLGPPGLVRREVGRRVDHGPKAIERKSHGGDPDTTR